MIRSIVRVAPNLTGREEVVIVPIFQDDKGLTGPARKLDILCRSALAKALKSGRFAAKRGQTLLLATTTPRAPEFVLLLGLGMREELNAERAANAGGQASTALKSLNFKSANLLLPEVVAQSPDALHGLLKGFLLAQYGYSLKREGSNESPLRRLAVMTAETRVSRVLRRTKLLVEHVVGVRDWVNAPANLLTPTDLANKARNLSEAYGIKCRVLGRKELERMGMGAVLAVARGSTQEPRFIVMHYNQGGGRPRVCLVGKAVTFDSGGISIKPWQDMHEMKGDMAGGAVVIQTIAAAARMRLPIEAVALVPCVENMPDGGALRPGDVITTRDGRTVEILSTDAEGRLILADALSYAQEFRPELIVDFATLTGAVIIALGKRVAAVIGNDDSMIERLIQAGKRSAELVWSLPLDDVFEEAIKGDISDFKNYGGRDGSSITAAALLKQFVGRTPWLHVDIAGTFWSDSGKIPYHSKGATGYGVDLTLSFLESLLGG